MAAPTPTPGLTVSDVHVNVPLTNISVAFRQDNTQYIAARAFPIVPVAKRSDRYYEFPRDYWFRSEAEERKPASETKGSEYVVKNDSFYTARIYGVHLYIADDVRANADSVLAPDREATVNVTDQMLLLREKLWIKAFMGTGKWTGDTDQTGVTGVPSTNQFRRWDVAGSSPIEDVQKEIVRMAELTGRKPNKLILGPYVANALRNNPEIIDRVKFTQRAFLDFDILAPAFGVDEVLVPFATQNTAAEGEALAMQFLYGKQALLVYSPPSAGLLTPAAGYVFSWQGYLNGTADIAIARWRDLDKKADKVEGEMAFDMKQIATDLGIFYTTAIS